VPRLHLFPITVLGVVIAGFGLLINWLGLVLSAIFVTIVGARAGPEFRALEAIALALALAAFSVAVFVYALGLPLRVWPQF
jgi:hypothetical protein